jgi:hypothetical protein
MTKTGLLIAFIVSLSAATLFAAPSAMQEGKWEVTMKMDMEGAPFPMPPMVFSQCITKEDLKDPKKTLPGSSDKKNDCTVKDYAVSGSKITWRMQCKDGSTGSGEMVYKGTTSYSGTLKMTTTDKKHGTSKIVQHISGKWIGACK